MVTRFFKKNNRSKNLPGFKKKGDSNIMKSDWFMSEFPPTHKKK
jgi:hypothetical protein